MLMIAEVSGRKIVKDSTIVNDQHFLLRDSLCPFQGKLFFVKLIGS